jgi:parallel beta helix pectate lyase-like protein
MIARLAVVALALWSIPAYAFDVTTCHQTVPPHETGVLLFDLVCDAQGGPDVTLSRHAHLNLNGHTISGGYIGVATDPGHIGTTRIEGPGEIFGVGAGGGAGDPFGCGIATSGKAKIRNVTLHDNLRGIVNIYDFVLQLEDVTIRDNALEGIASYFANLGGTPGPGNGEITGRRIDVSGNGDNGIEAYGKLMLRDSTVSGNSGAGIVSNGRLFVLQNVMVLNNVGGVVSPSSKRGKLKDSTATGNRTAGDIAAKVAPKLIRSTCEHSIFYGSNGTLGICSGD